MVEGSLLKEARAEAIIEAPIEVLYEIISIPDTWKNWFGMCKDSKTLQKFDKNTIAWYVVLDLPFPFRDRDGCLLMKMEKNFEEGTAWFEAEMIPDSEDDQYGMDVVTKENRRVRPKKLTGSCGLTRVGQDKTKAIYQVGGNPKLFLPTWCLNFMLSFQPVLSIKGIKEEVKKKYIMRELGYYTMTSYYANKSP